MALTMFCQSAFIAASLCGRMVRRVTHCSATFAALALAGIAAFPGTACAETARAVATAQATVVAPLALVKVQDLQFGRIVARATAGTITINENTGQCVVGGAIKESGTCQFASFSGMGSKNLSAHISISALSNLTGPGQAMVLDNIAIGTNATLALTGGSNGKGGGAPRYAITSASGIFLLTVGGRLNVNANQAPGVYTGSISVTVQYQ
jgi:spore coat protein U-like protein